MEMETTILKNLITDSEFYGKVYPYIEKHHFQSVETSEIFGSLQQYVLKYDTQPNMMELGLFIKNNNTTAENLKTMVIDGYKRIMSDPSVQNKEFLITETEKYIQKIELTNAIIKGAEIIEQDEPFETVVGLVEQAISMNFDADIGLDYKSSVDDRFSYYTEKILGVPCGIASVDKALGSGYRRKTLNIVVAPSHGGKSALLVADAANMLMKKQNVLFVTLEMPEYEIAKRIDANLLNVSANELGTLGKAGFKSKLDEINKHSGELRIKEYSSGSFNTIKLKSLMSELESEGFKADVVCIDYITLMSSSRTTLAQIGSTYSYYKLISEELHGFSKSEDIIMLTAAQLNRGSYDNLEAGLDSIADSLGVIQTADTVLAILANGQLREMDQAILKFLKNRNTGALSSHLVGVNFNVMRFTDMDEGYSNTPKISQSNALEGINANVLQSAVDQTKTSLNTNVMNFD